MGTFSISSKRDMDADALVSSVSISDDDINRITVAYAHLYFPNGVTVPEVPGVPGVAEIPEVPATFDEDGNELTPAIPAVPAVAEIPAVPASVRPPTGTEVFDAVTNGLLQGLIANTISVEKSTAAQQAQENVPPINTEPA